MKRSTEHGGVLLVDKPSGPTSFDVVRWVRRTLQIKKVGHTGTLDPLASGLLVVCVGEATKLVPYLMEGEKQYRAVVGLGRSTNTDDREGQTLETAPLPRLQADEADRALQSFVGNILQVPPAFAAIKKNGEPLYVKARRGETVEVEPRPVIIHNITLEEFETDSVSFDVTCGKGTYIRSLARDLGKSLGTVAHLAALRRTSNSGYSLDGSRVIAGSPNWTLEELRAAMIAPSDAVSSLPLFTLGSDELQAVNCGRGIPIAENLAVPSDGTLFRLNDADGFLTAIARFEDGVFQPIRVFARG